MGTDEDLIKGLRNGDTSTFQQIYKDSYPMILDLVTRNSGNYHDAEDLFHDGLIAIIRSVNKPSFQLTSSLSTYLYSVCKNLWLKKLRTKKSSGEVTNLEGMVSSIEDDVHEVVERSEKMQLLLDQLQKLGTDCQRIMKMFFEKRDYAFIMNEMGFGSEGYTRKRKHECQKRLIDGVRNDSRFEDYL